MFNKEEHDKIHASFYGKKLLGICPACSKPKPETLIYHSYVALPSNSDMAPIKAVAFLCKHCGYVSLFQEEILNEKRERMNIIPSP